MMESNLEPFGPIAEGEYWVCRWNGPLETQRGLVLHEIKSPEEAAMMFVAQRSFLPGIGTSEYLSVESKNGHWKMKVWIDAKGIQTEKVPEKKGA